MTDWSPPAELPDLRRAGTISLDTETKDDRLHADMGSGWPFHSGHLCGVSVAFGAEGNVQGSYFPIRHPDTQNFAPEQVYRWVCDHIAAGVCFVTQNGLYDWGWLRTEANVKMPCGDHLEEISALATSVNENRYQYSLDALCRWRGLPGKDETLLREGIAALGLHSNKRKKLVPQNYIWQLPARYVGPYAEADAVNTLLLQENLNPILDREGTHAAYRLECDILPMVLEMRLRGIRVDLDAADQARTLLLHKRDTALAELSEKLGAAISMHEIQGRKWLVNTFDRHGIEYPRTELGNASFRAGKTGWMVGHAHWLPQLIATANKYDKAATDFVQKLIDYAVNGRIHAEINPHRSEDNGAKSFRFSYSDPPLQQMPKRDEELAPLIRGLFLPEEGEIWATPDASQQEFRLVVHYANQHKLNKADEAVALYRNDPNTDFHVFAATMTGLDRSAAKAVNFAKIYGAGVKKFALMIGKPPAETQRIYEQYDRELPFLRQLSRIYSNLARAHGYITLYDGARRHFDRFAPGGRWTKGAGPCDLEEARQRLKDPNHPWYRRGPLYRADTYTALNALIQGSAARHTKRWMLACWREGIVPLLQMHDCLECSVGSREQAQRVAQLGCEAVQLDVPMRVDLKFGRTWGDARHSWHELHGSKQEQIPVTAQSPDNVLVEPAALPWDDDAPATGTAEPLQVCIHCRRELPDGSERVNAYNGGWLHPECVDAFIQVRLGEEGIPDRTEHQSNDGGGSGANGDGVGDSGNDDDGDDGSRGDYGHEEPADEPYDPIRIQLINRGYRQVCAFDFVLPGGTTLFTEDRYELATHVPATKRRPRKTCRFRHNVNGAVYSGTGPRRIIYHWPAIMAAGPGATVFVVEGANKANPLIAAGLLATAAPYHQWADECVEALAGRHLLYLEDHDYPYANGCIKAKELSTAAQIKLAPRAASFRIVPAQLLWKNLGRKGKPPHGWDVKDWIEHGGGAAKLLSICKQVPAESNEVIEPIDLWGRFDPPPLPTGLLPKVIEQFAREEGDLMGADPSGLAMAALTVSAAALSDHTRLQVKRHDPHWLEAARLWTGLIGNPSTKKTPIMLRAAKPLMRLDAELWREYLAAKEVYDELSREQRKDVERPKQKRLRLEDTTIEAAQDVLKDSPDGVLLFQDELAGWFGAMDKYSGRGANKDRGFWLQSYHGGSYPVNRISRGSFMIENLSACLLGGIQPDPIRKIAADTVDDGLLQRLMLVLLKRGTAGKDAPTGQAARDYEELIEELHERGCPQTPLQFNDTALTIREELEQRHLNLMAYEVINRKLAAHIGKYDGLFARLCLLWHCIEGTESLIVTEHTARRVADLMRRFLLPHATAFYAGMLELSDDHDRLTKVAGYILAKKLTRLTNRDVQRGNNAMRGLERQEMENVFDQLEALGWVFRTPGPLWSKPPHWLVNPEVHRRFAERAAREVTQRERDRDMIQEMFSAQAKEGRQ